MITALIITGLVLTVVTIVALALFLEVRRRIREQKNIERGLKMVPLLIHLPPPSEDIDGSGRDARDLTDENISKGQVIYNIIASTLRKDFKAKVHGQRHFAFEIVASKGFAHFYAAVPLGLVEVVKQAIVSAYPSARLEEAAEHNIFSPIGKINGTVGGELSLKESFAYPIATYQDLKRDAMQALLNALSALDKEDGAGIQILLRPAESWWRKAALAEVGRKRKGNDKKGLGVLANLSKDFLTAFVKAPEAKGDSGKELSALEQSVLDSMEDKTRHPGYEVLIRVVVSSNIHQRAQALLNNIVAAFSLFDAQGKNGFKFTPAKNLERFISSYILRIFPQEQNKSILNAVELATVFHFPDQRSIPTAQLKRQDSKQVDAPRNMPDTGLLLGYNLYRGVKKPIRLELEDRQRHLYAVGQTGTGKSVFLENLALQDMLGGRGFAFVDPHGDTVERLLAMVPKERTEDVIYFSPADMEYPLGLNMFEFQTSDQKDFLIQEVLNMLYKMYDPQRQGIMGPRYEDIFRNAALAVMADPEGGTMIEIPQLFRDPQFLKSKLQHVKDQTVLDYWQKQYPASQRSNEAGEVTAWFTSKFGAFLSNEMMRNIIGQTKSAFNLRDIMDNKKILLVNLSKGRTGDLNSKLLGMIFVMKFQAAAMSRANIPEDERQDFALYVDEFQNFSTDSFATIMSEARKYHLNLIVANQFTTQLSEEIRDAVFGNMGTIVAFRIGQNDVEALTRYFQPAFDGNDLLRIPNHNTIVRTLIGGVPTQPFSMATLPPLGTPNPELATALKQLSAAKYGRPKSVVQEEIFKRLATPPTAAPQQAFGSSNPFGPVSAPPGGVGPVTAPAKPTGTGSFLDEWMDKRTGPLTMRPSPWSKAPAANNPPSASQPTTPAASFTGNGNPPAVTPQTPYAMPTAQQTMQPPAPAVPTVNAGDGEISLRGSQQATSTDPDASGVIHAR